MDQATGPWSSQAPALDRSSELYIRDYPHRSIAIVSPSHALILRYSSTASESVGTGSFSSIPSVRSRNNVGETPVSKCMVEFAPISNQLLRDYRPLTSRPIYGTLGLITANNEVFLSVITHATRAATIRPEETVERIGGVAFYCLSSADYDDVVPLETTDPDISDAVSTYTQNSPYGPGLRGRDVPLEHPCHELRKLLGNGTFYYSTDFDVTNRAQDRAINSASFDIDNFDDSFLWNSFMVSPLVQFRSRLMPHEREALDASRILTSAFRGFSGTMTIPQSSSPIKTGRSRMPCFLTLVSRLSCRRAGTRFNARGIDDDGNVANFVETETTFWSPSGVFFSYAQVRGSVPVFWEQAADLIPGRQKITVTRSPDGTQPAFDKHFEDIEKTYGAVHVINLLSESKPGEAELSNLYRNGIRHCPLARPAGRASADHALLRDTHYDFHAETKGPAGYEAAKEIRRYIEDSTDSFAYFLAEEAEEPGHDLDGSTQPRMVAVLQQDGVFRTNCLDCLDRTNLIQTLISQMAVEAFLGHRGEFAASDFWMRHSSVWADNGDSLSKIYAGTGALKSSFTRHGKMSLAGAVADMRKSVQRIYHNNFIDPTRQITIDMLLGRLVGQTSVQLFDPINEHVLTELNKRSDEFTSSKNITMWVGTFNLNGRTNGVDSDLSPWLFPEAMGETQPDIYVVGFQEIVELSPQQIMNSDPSRRALWEEAVKRALNRRQKSIGGDSYVLLRSGQLVGAALCIFVKTSVLSSIKNVEGSVKKTGLSGIAGNKGAVAIRFDFASTHICFVTAHLAAGFANYDERNRDYATIHHGLRFQRNRGIEDHDTIVWLGDFNYRIGLSSDAARTLVKRRDLERLYENDQLNLQMVAGLSFPFYSEARITFMPTYKFDLGKDEYDTSEKARIPAWTDRILRKGSNIRQILYDSAPLRFSDHRPVYATFECRVSIVDEPLRESISQELYERRKADVGDTIAHAGEGDDTEDEDLIGYDAIEPGLPPASSDHQKWWLDNKQPAKAQIAVPSGRSGQQMMLNPDRNSNPFGQSEEPDWVAIPRSSSRQSFSSISSSPYEKVSMPSIMASAQTIPRKLPPPLEPTRMNASMGQLSLGGDRSGAPPPPPPRRQTGGGHGQGVFGTPEPGLGRTATQPLPPRPDSGASSRSSQPARSSNGPPPVARKPAHLANASPIPSPASTAGSNGRTGGQNGFAPPLPSRTSTFSSTQPGSRRGPSTVAAGAARASPSQFGGVGLAGMSTQSDGRPGVPSRKGVGTGPGQGKTQTQGQAGRHAPRGSLDLLGSLDEGGQSMGGWETLQPSKNG